MLQPGQSWLETIPIADEGPVAVRMIIEGCAPFNGHFRPGANIATLIVRGCEFRLVQD